MKLLNVLIILCVSFFLTNCSDNATSTDAKDNSTAQATSNTAQEKPASKLTINTNDDVAKADREEESLPLPSSPEINKKKTANTDSELVVNMSTDFDANYLMGKFDPKTHKDFTAIKSQHASYGGMLMRKDAYTQFVKMYEAAKKDGVYLKIISATRPFHHQKRIWNAKWTGKRKVDGKLLAKAVRDPEGRALKILRWSSMPGTSRHHWGTDIDLNNLNNSYFATGTGKKMYDWLVANASTYGFCQVYSPKDEKRPDGYQEEKWHWSYIPVSKKLTNLYKEKIKNGDIKGFEGAESAEMIDVVQKYVLGINQDCM